MAVHNNVPLITTLASAFGLSFILGFIAIRLKMPALVGYLLAGVCLGPFTPGYVANAEIAKELAEVGVMLLMFGVGLHFSLNDLWAVRKIALPGALLQMAVATVLGTLLAFSWGWNLGGALIFGVSLSVASTIVLIKTLESQGTLQSRDGRIAVGWLVVEDLIMVLVLVVLPPLAGWLGGNTPHRPQDKIWLTLGITFVKLIIFIFLMVFIGGRAFPSLLRQVARTRSRELFTLCIVTAAISVAYAAAKLFGTSFALGAFFAGMMLSKSELSHRAAEESLPLRDAFAVLFFVSVGMLFDPAILIESPLQILAVVGTIMIGKSIAAAGLMLAFRYPLSSALTIAASLAQIGEFSFILLGLGLKLGLISLPGQNLVLAGALISIALNPLLFALLGPLQKRA